MPKKYNYPKDNYRNKNETNNNHSIDKKRKKYKKKNWADYLKDNQIKDIDLKILKEDDKINLKDIKMKKNLDIKDNNKLLNTKLEKLNKLNYTETDTTFLNIKDLEKDLEKINIKDDFKYDLIHYKSKDLKNNIIIKKEPYNNMKDRNNINDNSE